MEAQIKFNAYCQDLETEYHLIPEERKEKLKRLSDYISSKYRQQDVPKLIVICTHNSRRSHIGQLWLAIGADHFGLDRIETFSGGTEATAFNYRAVKAFQSLGLEITTKDQSVDNPMYEIKWQADMAAYHAFSKKYDASPNPSENFGAIMVCTSADEGCPVVSGSDFRLSLPFDDPKSFDDTDLESEKYLERIRQIGREIFYSLSQIR